MRIATITNWAYGVTVCLTIASGIVMLMASHADNIEREAVKQRQVFDQLTEEIETDTWMLSDLARLYVIQKEPEVLEKYQAKEAELKNIEHTLRQLKNTGASGEELALLYDGLKIVDDLQDERQPLTVSPVARNSRPFRCCLVRAMSWNSNGHTTLSNAFACCWTSALLPTCRPQPKRPKRFERPLR